MKVTLPSGVIIESTDDVEAEWLAKLVLLNGTGTSTRPTPPPKKSHHKKVTSSSSIETESLSKQLTETWNWLVAHDNPNGVNVHQVAEGLSITVHAATFRLNGLIRKGLARRLRRGWYRPGEDPQSQQPVPMPQVVIAENSMSSEVPPEPMPSEVPPEPM